MSAAPQLAESLWSATKLKTFHACPRKFRYRYIDGIGEPPTDAQRYGTAVHAALEQWLLRHDLGAETRLAAALAAIQLADPFEAARARAVMLGYECRWGALGWRVLAVEVPFLYELDGHLIQGQIDAIVEMVADGRRYVVEHKNDSRDIAPGGANWERLTIDTQVSIYTDGAAMLGYEIDGVVYDVLAKPKHAPKPATPLAERTLTKGKGCKGCGGSAGGKNGVQQGRGSVSVDGKEYHCLACGGSDTSFGTGWAEEPRLHAGQRDADEPIDAFEARMCDAIASDPEAFYQRATIVRTENDLPVMRSDLLDTIRLARVATALACFPKNTSACASFGSMCFFMPLCNRSADQATDSRFQRRTRTE